MLLMGCKGVIHGIHISFRGSDHLVSLENTGTQGNQALVVLLSCPRKAALACVELLESVRDRSLWWDEKDDTMIRCSYMTYHAVLKETLFFLVYIYRIIMNSWSLARLYPVPGVPCCICWYQSINVLVSRWRHQFASGCTSTMPRVVPGTQDFMCRLMSTCGIHLYTLW